MALPSVPYDFDISLSLVDRNLERRVVFKAARHPSESMERLWLRVLAYCWKWDEHLGFGPGLSDPDAPDLLMQNLIGDTTFWMRVGKADPAKIQRAADRNPHAQVSVLFESPARMKAFVDEAKDKQLARLEKVELAAADTELIARLASVEERRSRLTLTIVADHCYFERNGQHFDAPIELGRLLS